MSTTPCGNCFTPGVEGILTMKGDGKCPMCAGSGKTGTQHAESILLGVDEDCSKCGGTGECPDCGGTGWSD